MSFHFFLFYVLFFLGDRGDGFKKAILFFIKNKKKKGAKGDSNPRPLAPKARIIPLDHEPEI